MAITLEAAEKRIRELADERIRSFPSLPDTRSGDMEWPVFTISPEQIATAAECDGLINVSVEFLRAEQVASGPLSHTDSVSLGMMYVYSVHYSITVTPLRANDESNPGGESDAGS